MTVKISIPNAIALALAIPAGISITTRIPVSDVGVVLIKDQNGNVIGEVSSPGEYQVYVITEINDEEPYEGGVIIE